MICLKLRLIYCNEWRKNEEGTRVKTTIDYALQNRVNQIARYYYNQYKQNEVNNLAILVIDVSNRNVMSYVGNAPTDKDHQKDVDIIDAPRSTGSILKTAFICCNAG